MKLWKEFKEFAFKGNVIDLAVGVIIGSAFTAIVNSVVNDLFTPLLSLITGRVDFSTLAITLGAGENAAKIAYGSFLQAVFNFLMVAICIFAFVKAINKLHALGKKDEEPEPEEPETPTAEELLTEIREVLKEQQTRPTS